MHNIILVFTAIPSLKIITYDYDIGRMKLREAGNQISCQDREGLDLLMAQFPG